MKNKKIIQLLLLSTVFIMTNCQTEEIFTNTKYIENTLQKTKVVNVVSLKMLPEVNNIVKGIKKEKNIQNKSINSFEINHEKIIQLSRENGDKSYSLLIEKTHQGDDLYTVENLNILSKNGNYEALITKWIPSDGKPFYDVEKFIGELQYLDLNGNLLHTLKIGTTIKTSKSNQTAKSQIVFEIGCWSYEMIPCGCSGSNYEVISSSYICGGGSGGGTSTTGSDDSDGTGSTNGTTDTGGGGGGVVGYTGSGTTTFVPYIPTEDEVERKMYNTFLISLNAEQYSFLGQYPEVNLKIFNYLRENGFTTINKKYAKGMINPLIIANSLGTNFSVEYETWAINYLLANPNLYVSDLINNRTSFDTVLGDLDNNTVGGYDNTTYANFNPQQSVWIDISSVIPVSQFIGFGYPGIPRNCMDYAKAQIAKKGYKISNYGATGQTFQIYREQTGVNQSQLSLGLNYLKYALSNGVPVIVGVDDAPGVPKNKDGTPGNPDLTTDHFIVIVGMGSNINGNYFQFYDNASGYSSQGANSLNLLYYNNTTGIISGRSQTSYAQTPGLHNYIITHIRKSKP